STVSADTAERASVSTISPVNMDFVFISDLRISRPRVQKPRQPSFMARLVELDYAASRLRQTQQRLLIRPSVPYRPERRPVHPTRVARARIDARGGISAINRTSSSTSAVFNTDALTGCLS